MFENHENGQLKYEIEVEDGILVENRSYYDDGQLRGKQTQFKEEDYYKNGQLRRKAHYNQDGERDGLLEKYFEDGRLRYKYTYKDNIKDGPYESNVDNSDDLGYGYYSEGILKEKNYKDGQVINEGDTTSYNIGDIVNGGVVFWLDSTGQHGLVVAFSDVATSVEWGCFGQDLPNVPNVNLLPPVGQGAEIGGGFNNTNNILKDCPSAPAALAARSYGPDWFLPSTNEFNQMYINKTTLDGVSGFTPFSNFYWSSTEEDNVFAWIQGFDDGIQNSIPKDQPTDVRAVRAF